MRMRNTGVSEFQGAHIIPPPPERFRRSPRYCATKSMTPMNILWESLRNTTELGKRVITKNKMHTMEKMSAFSKDKLTQIIAHATGCVSQGGDRFLNAKKGLTKHACFKEAVSHFDSRCFEVPRNPYVVKYLRLFINLSEEGVSTQDLWRAMNQARTHPRIVGIS